MQRKIVLLTSLLILALIILPTKGAVLTQKMIKQVNPGTGPPGSDSPVEVPVPATVVLFVSGIVGLVGINRRLKK